jgi:hypothetical protein
MGLPLYLVERIGKIGYDEARAFVVAAEDADQARVLLSSPMDADDPDDSSMNRAFAGDEGMDTWLDDAQVSTKIISLESTYAEPTVVLRSFRHG